jgi:quinol monooxygenase YgiN
MVIVSLSFSPRTDVHEEVLTAWAKMVKASQAESGCM